MTRKLTAKMSVALVGALLVSACGGRPDLSFEQTASVNSPTVQGMGYALVQNRGPSDAFIVFPSRIGQVVSVDERVYANGISQYISLNADAAVRGENNIEVRLVGQKNFSDMVEKIEPHSLKSEALRAQFNRSFPTDPFSVDPTLHFNEYGSFAFSFLSKSGGIGCLFGWQNVEAQTTNERTRYFFASWSDRRQATNNAKLSYRIRYCSKGLTWADAVYLMKSIRVDVPTDVFTRRRDIRWSSGAKYLGNAITSDPVDMHYSTGLPHTETRDLLCSEPGSIPGGYGGYGTITSLPQDNCAPVKPKPVAVKKPVVRPAPVAKVVQEPVQVQPAVQQKAATPAVDPSLYPTIPLPGTGTAPTIQGTTTVNPVIQSPVVQSPIVQSPRIIAPETVAPVPAPVPSPVIEPITPAPTAPVPVATVDPVQGTTGEVSFVVPMPQ